MSESTDLSFETLGLTEPVGSMREHVLIFAPVDAVWARVADVPNNSSWFTALDASWCEADPETGRPLRMVTTPTGMTMVEDIVRVDAIARRLQYRLRPGPIFDQHLATIDVIDLCELSGHPPSGPPSGHPPSDHTQKPITLVVYSTELRPAPLAIAFNGATRAALDTLKQQTESAWTAESAG
jgi:Polyketide cyclase / dehydrase and lipid transport